MENKSREIWIKDDKEKVQNNLKEKSITNISLSMNVFFSRVSHCNYAKQMRDILQLTHKSTIEVNNGRNNTLTHEYELFRIKLEENVLYTLWIT